MGGSQAIDQLYDGVEVLTSWIVWVVLMKPASGVEWCGRTSSQVEYVVRENGYAVGGMAWRQITADW